MVDAAADLAAGATYVPTNHRVVLRIRYAPIFMPHLFLNSQSAHRENQSVVSICSLKYQLFTVPYW
jgi:hypothetical protein